MNHELIIVEAGREVYSIYSIIFYFCRTLTEKEPLLDFIALKGATFIINLFLI